MPHLTFMFLPPFYCFFSGRETQPIKKAPPRTVECPKWSRALPPDGGRCGAPALYLLPAEGNGGIGYFSSAIKNLSPSVRRADPAAFSPCR